MLGHVASVMPSGFPPTSCCRRIVFAEEASGETAEEAYSPGELPVLAGLAKGSQGLVIARLAGEAD